MVIGMYLMLTMQFGNKGGRLDDAGGKGDELDNYQKSNALLSDVIINYRTIISLGQKNVDSINDQFEKLLVDPMKNVISQSNKMGMYFALGTAGRMLYVCIMFAVSISWLIPTFELDSTAAFESMYMLFFSYMSIGAQASNVPSIKNAKAAAIPVFSIIDEPSQLDVRKPGHRDLKVVKKGHLEFKNCHFNYPTRAQKVMNNFSVDIPAGAKIALVG